MTPSDLTRLDAQLHGLPLPYIQSHYQALATRAAEQQRSHLDYLAQLVEGEATMRENRSIERRIRLQGNQSVALGSARWPLRIHLHSQARFLAQSYRGLFSKLARSVLRHIHVASKQELRE